MKNELNRMLKTSIVSWVVFIVLGIFLFLKAEFTLKMISYVVGGALLCAFIPLTKHILDKEKNYSQFEFIIEIFMVVAGIVLILNPELIASIIPLLIGILLIMNGISKLQLASTLRINHSKMWTSTMMISICIIAIGVILVVNPFGIAVAVTKMIGLFILIYSILDMIDFKVIHKDVKNMKEIESITVTKEKNIKIIEGEE